MTPPLVAVASAALQPYDVRLTGAPGHRIVIRRGTADVEAAMATTGLSLTMMLAMLGARRAHISAGRKPRPYHIAAPTLDAGSASTWDRFTLNLWALRMGLFHDRAGGWVPLIGYAGLALVMGVEEQTVRSWASDDPDSQRRHADFPAAACEIDTEGVVTCPLFPVFEARRFGQRLGRIDPKTSAEDIPRLVVAEALRRAAPTGRG